MEIDLAAAVAAKMIKNRAKYPAERYKGRFGPQDKRQVSESE